MQNLHEFTKQASGKSTREYNDRDVAADRVANFSETMEFKIRAGLTQIDKKTLGHTDSFFMLEALLSHIKEHAINAISQEKKVLLRRIKSKAMFLETLDKNGGVLSSAEVSSLLGKSKVTVKNRKDEHKLLALNIDDEFYYPVFQFTEDKGISHRGVLKGMEELLPLICKFSDRLQYSFFMEKRNTVLDGLETTEPFTVVELLRSNPSSVVMSELIRLATLYGSQDLA